MNIAYIILFNSIIGGLAMFYVLRAFNVWGLGSEADRNREKNMKEIQDMLPQIKFEVTK